MRPPRPHAPLRLARTSLARAVVAVTVAFAVVVFAVVAATPAAWAQPARTDAEARDARRAARLDAFAAELEALRATLRIPAMAVAVVQDGEVAWAGGFGLADPAHGVPATPDTPFQIASVTKPLAATLTMRLIEDGLLSLDDPVARDAPDGPKAPAADPVTIRHLLSHTSGPPPGRAFRYDGVRYARLEGVLTAAAGRSFGDLLDSELLVPLGMARSGPADPTCGAGDRARAAGVARDPRYAGTYAAAAASTGSRRTAPSCRAGRRRRSRPPPACSPRSATWPGSTRRWTPDRSSPTHRAP